MRLHARDTAGGEKKRKNCGTMNPPRTALAINQADRAINGTLRHVAGSRVRNASCFDYSNYEILIIEPTRRTARRRGRERGIAKPA